MADGLCPTEMVVANRLAECPRSAVDHEPEPTILIRLNLDEVIPTPERCELENAITPPDGLKTGVAKRYARQITRLRNSFTTVAPASWHSPAQFAQHLSGRPWIVQSCTIHIRGHSHHAASYVAPDRLRID
jgi:hypothetical protein